MSSCDARGKGVFWDLPNESCNPIYGLMTSPKATLSNDMTLGATIPPCEFEVTQSDHKRVEVVDPQAFPMPRLSRSALPTLDLPDYSDFLFRRLGIKGSRKQES